MMSRKKLIAFENKVARLFNSGKLKTIIHLSGGNEDDLIRIFSRVKKCDWKFSTWRSHYHYLLSGGSENKLLEMVKAGRSMHIYDKELNFFTSAIVGGILPIAVGVAASIKRRNGNEHVWCFCGDGAEDQGVFTESVRYVDGHNLPCTFIIEDNGLSVETQYKERWGNNIMKWPACVERYDYDRKWPHCQTGTFVKEYL